MGFGGIKRTPADAAFSDCVREAHDYNCQHCGKNNRDNPKACHLSHFCGRRAKSTRWFKENGFCLCAGCHMYMGEHPHEHDKWVRSVLGEGLFQVLIEQSQTLFRVRKQDEKEIAKHYRDEKKKILEKRKNGQEGFIDFVGY